MLLWFGSLFVMAWAIGVLTVPHAPWFLHLPLLVGGGAMLVGILPVRRRRFLARDAPTGEAQRETPTLARRIATRSASGEVVPRAGFH